MIFDLNGAVASSAAPPFTPMVMGEGAMSKVYNRDSRLAKAVIAIFVFAVGVLGGAGAAALLMPTWTN
jgi:hypothetical protein